MKAMKKRMAELSFKCYSQGVTLKEQREYFRLSKKVKP